MAGAGLKCMNIHVTIRPWKMSVIVGGIVWGEVCIL